MDLESRNPRAPVLGADSADLGNAFITRRDFSAGEWSAVVAIDLTCNLEGFRRFLVNSTCRSFIPESYLRDPEVFPEKEGDQGSIYVEAVDKVDLKKIRDITFINARDVLGIIYTSKSGNTKLKWRQIRARIGRVSGEASGNSLVNLSMARIISPEDVEAIMANQQPQAPEEQAPAPESEEQPPASEEEASASEEAESESESESENEDIAQEQQ